MEVDSDATNEELEKSVRDTLEFMEDELADDNGTLACRVSYIKIEEVIEN